MTAIKFFDKFIGWSSDSNNKSYKWISIIFAPIMFFIIKRECKLFWDIILDEISDKEEIIDFLDRNEFGLVKNKIYKKDVIDQSNDLYIHSPDNLKQLILKEYSEMLLMLLHKHCVTDIENYISLLVDVDLIRQDNSMMKLYTVSIVYYRYSFYLRIKSILKWWLGVVLSLSTIFTILYIASIYV